MLAMKVQRHFQEYKMNRLLPTLTKGQTSIPGSAVLRFLHLPAPVTTPEIPTLTKF